MKFFSKISRTKKISGTGAWAKETQKESLQTLIRYATKKKSIQFIITCRAAHSLHQDPKHWADMQAKSKRCMYGCARFWEDNNPLALIKGCAIK